MVFLLNLLGCGGTEQDFHEYEEPTRVQDAHQTESEDINIPGFSGCDMADMVLPITEEGIDYTTYCPQIIGGSIESSCNDLVDDIGTKQFETVKNNVLSEYSIFDLIQCKIPLTVCYEYQSQKNPDGSFKQDVASYIFSGNLFAIGDSFITDGIQALQGLACYANEIQSECLNNECSLLEFDFVAAEFDMRTDCANSSADALSIFTASNELIMNDLSFDADCSNNNCTILPASSTLINTKENAAQIMRGWADLMPEQLQVVPKRDCITFGSE